MGASLGSRAARLSSPEDKQKARRYAGVSSCDTRYMILAAKDGDLVRLKKSLFVLSPLEAQDAYLDTPLHHAAVRGHLEACAMLLRCEPSLIKAVNKGKNTALHLAASAAHLQVVKLLLDHRADIDARGIEQYTPLHYACRDSATPRRGRIAPHLAVVKLLVERGSNPDLRTRDGALPRDLASTEELRACLPGGPALAVTKEEYERRLGLLLNACSRWESCSDDGDEDEIDESASQAEGMEGVLESLLPELSPSLLCPITHALLVDPVTTCDHHVYERYAITQGLERH